jgi:hypothetical protein
VGRAKRPRYDIKQVINVAGALPRTGRGDCWGVGERWVKAVKVPVQTTEAAGDDGESAAGAARAGGADDRVALGVFEAKEVDCFFLLPGRMLVLVRSERSRDGLGLLLRRVTLFILALWSSADTFEPVSNREGEVEGRRITLLDKHGEFAE